jgi:hypothetical protein
MHKRGCGQTTIVILSSGFRTCIPICGKITWQLIMTTPRNHFADRLPNIGLRRKMLVRIVYCGATLTSRNNSKILLSSMLPSNRSFSSNHHSTIIVAMTWVPWEPLFCMYCFLLGLFGTFLFCVPAYNKMIHEFVWGLTLA